VTSYVVEQILAVCTSWCRTSPTD